MEKGKTATIFNKTGIVINISASYYVPFSFQAVRQCYANGSRRILMNRNGIFFIVIVFCLLLTAAASEAAWETQAMDWETSGELIQLDAGMDRSFAWPENQPAGREVEVETMVTLNKRTSQGWGIAAVAIRQDDRNYWHLALVEAPDGRKHFVELSEMLDGNWLAQGAADSKLTASVWEGTNFDWQYGHKYKLRLMINDAGIEGTVSEADGKVSARVGFRFDNKAVKQGMPSLAGGAVSAVFSGFSASVKQVVPPPPPKTLPEYISTVRGKACFKATGFFRVEKLKDTWWYVDPLGKPFYLVGADHITYKGHWCEKLGYSQYGRFAKEKYGTEEAWGDETLKRLKQWGFNALPAGHTASLRYNGLPHIEFLSLGSMFAGREALCPKTTWTGFPDVFSPKWIRHCDSVARRQCAPNKGDAWLIGYFLDNELEWYGKNGQVRGLFLETWKLNPEAYGKKEWIRYLQKEFGSISGFNTAFGTSFKDFDGLLLDTNPHGSKTEEGADCMQKWVRHIADKYFSTCADAIRKYDPNHLILGCRFAGRAPEIWDIAGKYCDVVSFNIYPRIDIERGVPASVLEEVDEWAKKAARPMMVTEWSFPALDAGLPSRHGAGMRVDTQEQRAKCFSHFQEFLFRIPYIIGSCYFMYVDEPALGISSTFPEDSNYGLISEKDVPYPAITAAAANLNPEAPMLHNKGGFSPYRVTKTAIPEWMNEPTACRPLEPQEKLRIVRGDMSLEFPVDSKVWRMCLGGKPLADLFPMIHQYDGANSWTRPVCGKVTGIGENERYKVIDAEFYGPDDHAYTVSMRYWIPKSAGWIASQCLQVRNTGKKAWDLKGVYHYVIPLPADADNIPLCDVPNYYKAAHAWVDRSAGRGIGCWFAEDGNLKCNYWKDNWGYHSDMREDMDVGLKSGEVFKPSPDPAYFFPLSTATLKAYSDTCADIERAVAE